MSEILLGTIIGGVLSHIPDIIKGFNWVGKRIKQIIINKIKKSQQLKLQQEKNEDLDKLLFKYDLEELIQRLRNILQYGIQEEDRKERPKIFYLLLKYEIISLNDSNYWSIKKYELINILHYYIKKSLIKK